MGISAIRSRFQARLISPVDAGDLLGEWVEVNFVLS
jgi:hypothetical protein